MRTKWSAPSIAIFSFSLIILFGASVSSVSFSKDSTITNSDLFKIATDTFNIYYAKYLVLSNNKLIDLEARKYLTDNELIEYTKFPGLLVLDGLTDLTERQSEILSKKIGPISLGGIETLSDNQFRNIAKIRGNLFLRNVKTLTDSATEHLANHKNGDLFLFGLKKLSSKQANIFKSYKKYICIYSKIELENELKNNIKMFENLLTESCPFKWRLLTREVEPDW